MKIESLENRPTLTQWVTDYWEAFQLLSSSRIIHQGGVGPIPLSEIVSYLSAICLRDVDERLKMIRMVQSLDRVYVQHVNEKANKRAADHRKTRSRKPRKR